MPEIISHRAHLEFALNQGETIIFDEATYLEQRNMSLLMEVPDITDVEGQYDLEGRLHITNNKAQAKALRLASIRSELAEIAGKPVLTIIRGSKN